MLKKILFPLVLTLLCYGFYVSPDFKEIAAGVAIFLFGMLSLEEGFRTFTGGVLEKLLDRVTEGVWKSLGFGFISTTLVQSSGLVSVITISFLSAGLIDLASAMGIILGGNLGTATGGWVMAFLGVDLNLEAISMPLLVFGVLAILQPVKSIKGMGHVLVGLGFFILGMHYIKNGFEVLKDGLMLTRYAMTGYAGVVSFAFIGVFATLLLQSSHAMFFILVAALSSGQMTFGNAAAMVVGSNVGTTFTAVFGAIGANEDGKRLAAAHFLFNFLTAALFVIFFFQLTALTGFLSTGLGFAHGDEVSKLALFHTLFNVAAVIIMKPQIGRFEKGLKAFIKAPRQEVAQPRYLKPAALDFPDSAVEAVRRELSAMYGDVMNIAAGVIGFSAEDVFSGRDLAARGAGERSLPDFPLDEAYHKNVKGIFGAVILFISRAPFTWHETQSQKLHWLRNAGLNQLEAVKAMQHLRTNLIRHTFSRNAHLSGAYWDLRLKLAGLLRELNKMVENEEEDTLLLGLDQLKLEMAEMESIVLDRIYGLIRDGLIEADQGASLMKDYGYVVEIVANLAGAAGTIYGGAGLPAHAAQEALRLDSEELRRLARPADSRPGGGGTNENEETSQKG